MSNTKYVYQHISFLYSYYKKKKELRLCLQYLLLIYILYLCKWSYTDKYITKYMSPEEKNFFRSAWI